MRSGLVDGVGTSAPCVGPQHNHTKSALRQSTRSVGGQPVGTPRGESARTTRHKTHRDGQNLSKPVPLTCRSVGAMGPGRRRGEECALCWPTTQPCQIRTAPRRKLRGRSAETPQGESARTARHGTLGRWSKLFEARAADVSWCSCDRARAGSVGRSAPRVGPQYNHAKSALRQGACSVGGRTTRHGVESARPARHGIR